MNQPWVFRLSTRQYIRPLRNIDFFFIHCRRGSGDIMVSAWLDDCPNTFGRCITVWNLNAVGVVTGPTNRYSCIVLLCRMYYRINRLVYTYSHARTHCCWARNAVDYYDMIDTWTITSSRNSSYLQMSINASSPRIIYLQNDLFQINKLISITRNDYFWYTSDYITIKRYTILDFQSILTNNLTIFFYKFGIFE